MNSTVVHGKIISKISTELVKKEGLDTLLIKFTLVDKGIPYKQCEPMPLEVNYLKPPAFNILPFLDKGKEIDVFGHLSYTKDKVTNEEKYYLDADSILLCGYVGKKGEINGRKHENQN